MSHLETCSSWRQFLSKFCWLFPHLMSFSFLGTDHHTIEKCQFRKAPLEMLLALLFGRCQSKNFIMVNVVSIDEISTHLFVDCRDNVPYVTTQSRLRNHLDFEVESRTYLSRRSGKYTMPRVRKSSPSAAPVGVISKVLLILEA